MLFRDACSRDFKPFCGWMRTVLGQNLHYVSILKLGVNRHEFPAHLRADKMVSNTRVNRVCKINRRRICWKVHNVSLWSKNKDTVLEEILPKVLPEFLLPNRGIKVAEFAHPCRDSIPNIFNMQ